MKGLKQLGLFVVGGAVGMMGGVALTMNGHTTSAAETDTHNLVAHISTVKATCETAGEKDYWECADCGKFFSDAKGYDEIRADELEVWKVVAPLGHASSENYFHPQSKATCTTDGTIQYYVCSNGCGQFFADEDCEFPLDNVITDHKTGHSAIGKKVEYQAATCEADGHEEHYVCQNAGCDATFADIYCTKPIDAVIKGGHKFDEDHHYAYQNATCEEAGHEEHYICINDGCGQYFDADKNAVTADEIAIEKLGHHTYEINGLYHFEYKAATCDEDGTLEYWVCVNAGCGKKFEEKECLNEITYDVVLHALGHKRGDCNLDYTNICEAAYRYVDDNGKLVANTAAKYYQTCANCGKPYVENNHTFTQEFYGFAKLMEGKGITIQTDVIEGKDVYDLFTLDESAFVNGVAKVQITVAQNYHSGSQCTINGDETDLSTLVRNGSTITLTVNQEDLQDGMMVLSFDWDGDGEYEQIIKIKLA